MPLSLAIFDVDKTITKNDTFFRFFLFLLKKYPLRVCRVWKIPYLFFITRVFKFDRLLVKKEVVRLLNGCGEDEMKKVGKEFVQKVIVPDLMPKAKEEIEKYKNEKVPVILLSASLEIYLQFLIEFLPVEEVICTRTQIDGTQICITGDNCYGSNKIDRLKDSLYLRDKNIPYEEMSFYSDHHSDFPLMDKVASPYIVNGTNKFNSIAKEKKWKCLEWEL